MKAEKIETCGICKEIVTDSKEQYPKTGWCKVLHEIVATNTIYLLCPLPDWPEVSQEDIFNFHDNLMTIKDDEFHDDIDDRERNYIETWLSDHGVIITELEKEKEGKE